MSFVLGNRASMFNGFSTLGAVALQIAEDYIRFPMKADCRYSVQQAIFKVCMLEESIASSGRSPSYVWAWFGLDEGETVLEIDRDVKLAEVPLNKRQYRYVPLRSGDVEGRDLIPEYWLDDWEDRSIVAADYAMLRMGMGFHQKFLVRYMEEWSTDYYGESDVAKQGSIVYAKRGHSSVLMPMTNPMVLPKPTGSFSVQ